jgi:8-amino-7-oxononanoate synthase
MDPLSWIDDKLALLEKAHLRRSLPAPIGRQGAVVTVAGRQLVNFASNDYLSLAADRRLIEAATETYRLAGVGRGASPLVVGRTGAHERLERRLAAWEQTEAALLFSSGFAANTGVIPTLVDRRDAIFGDAKNHASILDGCRLARAEKHIYPHADMNALEQQLLQGAHFRRRLIVSDTLFSMDGDLAPLAQLARLAQQHQAMLMVDEAHATGLFGAQGRGVVEHLLAETPHLKDHIHIRVGTLSKALGAAGGFVCGSRRLIDWLANRARSYVFSTAPPASASAAALAAMTIIDREPERRQTVLLQARRLRESLQGQGWDTGLSSSQIVPIVIGSPAATMRLALALRERGFLVPGIRPPSVPAGESLLRLSLCYDHTPEMLDRLTETMLSLRHLGQHREEFW